MIQVTADKEFHLITKDTSYIIGVLPSGHIGSYYYGKRIREKPSYSNLFQYYSIYGSIETQYNSQKALYSLNQVCLEHSTFGKGDYREPSFHVEVQDGFRVTDFTYVSHEMYEGKKPLADLPHFFHNEDTVDTLEIVLEDKRTNIEQILVYNIFYDQNIITRHVEIRNMGATCRIEKISSMNLDLPSGDYELVSLYGHWIKEKHIERQPIRKGRVTIDSKRLSSSAIHNPFMAVVRPDATENKGECYGFSLVYSGNHECMVERSTQDITRIQLGIHSFDFTWELGQDEVFVTPEVVMTFSNEGLNGMSKNFHKAIRKNLIPISWQQKERPILFNSWEAMYFNFTEKKLMNLVKAGKKLGMEMFVLDDGWFKGRNDATSSLGDWVVDTKKLPNGLAGISKKVREQGLEFGLWVEPEMISIDSDLYRAHPDWAIQLPEGNPSLGRNQLILDYANPEVIAYIYTSLEKAFKEANVSYVKWDMNRNGTDLYSKALSKEKQGELSHRYYLGLYSLLKKLMKEFPNVLFESCASGGNRHDLGMLYYMPQTWISDNTDPGERMYAQYGASLLFPPETLGAHVGANPSHQVLRKNSIETRFNMAAFGALGYELDLTKLSNFEKKAIKNQISFYKKYRKILQKGEFYRIRSPFDTNNCTFIVHGENTSVLGDFQKLQKSYPSFEQIYIEGLEEDGKYTVKGRKQYMNIEVFGDLVNEQLPINLKTTGVGGLLHKTITENYMFEVEKFEVTGYGDEFMYAGIRLYPGFTGLGYDERTRYMGDFGSRMYVLEKERTQLHLSHKEEK